MAPALLSTGLAMKTNRSERGFTLIETLIILAIVMVLAVLTMPEIFAIMNRARLEGTARQTATLMRAARLEAIKQSCYGVVMLEPANERVIAFVDNDLDGVYEPTNVPPERMIGRVDLPTRIRFQDEDGNKDLFSVDDLKNSDTLATLPNGQVMYQSNGSVLDKGALHFADDRGNVLEVNIYPKSTGKVEVRKWQDGKYISNGEEGKVWKFIK
jgi:type II secretory pathway pseudopilin PulG